MRHKSYDQYDFLPLFLSNRRRQSCNHMKRARLESYDDAIGCNHMKRTRLESYDDAIGCNHMKRATLQSNA